MAVVVSAGQNEQADDGRQGAGYYPHRRRMNDEDLEAAFKDPVNPFRMVFVCAMWLPCFQAVGMDGLLHRALLQS